MCSNPTNPAQPSSDLHDMAFGKRGPHRSGRGRKELGTNLTCQRLEIRSTALLSPQTQVGPKKNSQRPLAFAFPRPASGDEGDLFSFSLFFLPPRLWCTLGHAWGKA
jgi:hypothetical protein